MSTIRSLFHPELPIDRPIEKVITFSNRQPDVLVREAREYIVTDNLASEYEKLLGYFEDAQAGGRGSECCVWLSGFYGSGKSSFAKYFGLSFDPSAQDGDTHFADHFVKQFPSKPFQIRLKTLRGKFNVAVFPARPCCPRNGRRDPYSYFNSPLRPGLRLGRLRQRS